MSPKIIPRATNNPNGETFLIFNDIDSTRSRFQMTGLCYMICKNNKEKMNGYVLFTFHLLQLLFSILRWTPGLQ